MMSRIGGRRKRYCSNQRCRSARSRFGKYRVVGSPDESHFLVAQIRNVWCVFGPHEMFYSSHTWVKLNATIGGQMAFATRLDESGSFFYVVFENGKNK
jgi:hypothetical protein